MIIGSLYVLYIVLTIIMNKAIKKKGVVGPEKEYIRIIQFLIVITSFIFSTLWAYLSLYNYDSWISFTGIVLIFASIILDWCIAFALIKAEKIKVKAAILMLILVVIEFAAVFTVIIKFPPPIHHEIFYE